MAKMPLDVTNWRTSVSAVAGFWLSFSAWTNWIRSPFSSLVWFARWNLASAPISAPWKSPKFSKAATLIVVPLKPLTGPLGLPAVPPAVGLDAELPHAEAIMATASSATTAMVVRYRKFMPFSPFAPSCHPSSRHRAFRRSYTKCKMGSGRSQQGTRRAAASCRR